MGGSVRPVPTTPDEAEFQAWKANASAPATHDDAEFRAWKTAQDQAATRYDGTRAHAGVVPSALDAMTFGLAPKGVAAVDAITDVVTGKLKPGDTFGTAYKQNLAANRAAAAQYHEAHPAADIASQLVGGVGGVVATGGLGAAGDAAQVGRLARFGKTIVTGAKYGAASGLGHSDALEQGRGVTGLATDTGKGAGVGAATGAVSIPLSAAAGKVIGATPLPRLITGAAQRVADVLPEGSAGQRVAQTVAGSLGRPGEANAIIARRAAMDAEAGAGPTAPTPPRRFPTAAPIRPTALGPRALPDDGNPLVIPMKPSGQTPFSSPESVRQFKPSPMALDQAGPNVEGLAEGIANRPGPGRAIVQKAVTDRQAAMRPAISGALETGTGVPASAELDPLQQAIDARTVEARALFGAARAETKGQSVASPTFDKIIRTPAGQKALQVAQARQGNMFAEGPSVPHGYSPEQWEGVKQAMTERGIPIPENVGDATAPLPDPETLHFMKEHLATLAKLGTQDGEAGTLSQSAKGALSVWGKVRDELPDVWKKADEAYAARSRIIDAFNKGRQVYSASPNPAGSPQKAIAKSLGALEDRVVAAPPEERRALMNGAATAAHAQWETAPNSVKSPGRIFARTPAVERQTALAFPSESHADEFQHVVGAWDKAQAQAERMTGNSATARRGAEQGERELVPLASLVGRPRMVLRSLIRGLDSEYQAGSRQQVDAEIAKVLTSPDGAALVKAAQAGDFRAKLLLALRLGVSGTAAEQTAKAVTGPAPRP